MIISYCDGPPPHFTKSDERIGRERLGRRCANAFRIWGLDQEPQQSEVFGVFEDQELKSMHDFAVHEALPDTPKVLYRAKLFVAILSVVELLHYDEPHRIKSWALTEDKALAGLSPYGVIEKRGLGGLLTLLGHVNQKLISQNLEDKRIPALPPGF